MSSSACLGAYINVDIANITLIFPPLRCFTHACNYSGAYGSHTNQVPPFVLVFQSSDQQEAISIGEATLSLSIRVMDMDVTAEASQPSGDFTSTECVTF